MQVADSLARTVIGKAVEAEAMLSANKEAGFISISRMRFEVIKRATVKIDKNHSLAVRATELGDERRTFGNMVRQLRVTQACRLLCQATRPISEICFEVGFGNLSNFNRYFRDETEKNTNQFWRSRRTMIIND